MNILIPVGMLILLDRAVGQQQQNIFMEKYKEAIQKYLMTGHEDGWQHCDTLSSNPLSEGVPQMSMNLDKIQTLNLKSAFAYSSCLLVNYHISSEASLSDLLDFGYAAIQHVRLALIIKMGSGMTLDMIKNTTKMPFLVAAQLDGGKEQFLCPVVGEIEPRLEQDLCTASYASYRNKTLRIGLLGLMPEFLLTSSGTIDGTGIRLINMLASILNFMPQVIYPKSMANAEYLVCTHYRILLFLN